jgi:hypothetical protein
MKNTYIVYRDQDVITTYPRLKEAVESLTNSLEKAETLGGGVVIVPPEFSDVEVYSDERLGQKKV